MVEIQGEVDQKERAQMMRPGIIMPDPKNLVYIPIFRLRILTSSGELMQVLYKGEAPGDADIGEIVRVRGINKGGIIHARSIYNLTTNSWVTPAPGLLQKLFGD